MFFPLKEIPWAMESIQLNQKYQKQYLPNVNVLIILKIILIKYMYKNDLFSMKNYFLFFLFNIKSKQNTIY